jgi:hypothetical protein
MQCIVVPGTREKMVAGRQVDVPTSRPPTTTREPWRMLLSPRTEQQSALGTSEAVQNLRFGQPHPESRGISPKEMPRRRASRRVVRPASPPRPPSETKPQLCDPLAVRTRRRPENVADPSCNHSVENMCSYPFKTLGNWNARLAKRPSRSDCVQKNMNHIPLAVVVVSPV